MYSVFHFPWIVYLKLCTTVLSYLYFMRALSSKFVAKSGIKWGLYEIFPTPAVLVLHPSGNILLHLSWYDCIWMHIIQISVLLKCKHNVKISFILDWKKAANEDKETSSGGSILCKTIKFRDFRKLCAPWKSFKEGDNHPISCAFSQRNGEEDTKEVSILGKAPTILGPNFVQIVQWLLLQRESETQLLIKYPNRNLKAFSSALFGMAKTFEWRIHFNTRLQTDCTTSTTQTSTTPDIHHTMGKKGHPPH